LRRKTMFRQGRRGEDWEEFGRDFSEDTREG
jgi:hypothetical protein